MEALAIFIVTFALLVATFLYAFHTGKNEQHDDDTQRLCQLIDEATARYPNEKEYTALGNLYADNRRLIARQKQEAMTTDSVEGLKSLLRDQRLISQEMSRQYRQEVYNDSHFNILTSA